MLHSMNEILHRLDLWTFTRFVDKTRFVDGFLGNEKSTNRVMHCIMEEKKIKKKIRKIFFARKLGKTQKSISKQTIFQKIFKNFSKIFLKDKGLETGGGAKKFAPPPRSRTPSFRPTCGQICENFRMRRRDYKGGNVLFCGKISEHFRLRRPIAGGNVLFRS